MYAHRAELPQHVAAKARLKTLAEGDDTWAIPVFCVGEFFRIVTRRRLFDPPFTAREATTALNRVLASPSLRVLTPGDQFVPLLIEAIEEAAAVGNLVFDAQIVALCRESGVRTLVTEDRDFARFSGLRIERL